ncbi:MAG: hypothetical protein M3Q08_15460 [Pseudomonadota bacterium]|nr:hypothetical protein [Pseudomonadota bacterium]
MTSLRLLPIAALASMVVGLPAAAKEIVIAVPGIPGPYCAYGLEKRLLELPGALSAATDWKRERIRLRLRDDARVTIVDVERAVKRADYPYDYKILAGGR